ncbi:MAG TPA: FGGY family carbohydrate kinase, partial [Anseongella sp.]|nr:FGGY family carbohydrate kinase [Anseongella sp.]
VLSSWKQLEDDRHFDIKALNFTTYGASFVHLDGKGKPVGCLYNYLKPFPEALLKKFYKKYGDQVQIATETASPPLGMLNSGLQLYWLKHARKTIFKKIRYSLHLPQYFSWLLGGKYCSEYTSVGCHTGLWDFNAGDYHRWVKEEGLDVLFPPLVKDPFNGAIGFRGGYIPVGTGLHDSSSALIPYRRKADSSFMLLSTGTWGITLNPFASEALSPELLLSDCLNFMTPEGATVRASRFFLGHYHDEMMKRLGSIFHPAAMKVVGWDREEVEKWSNVSLNGLVEDFEQWDMQHFKEFRHAYASLMQALVNKQARAIRLAAGAQVRHNTLYLDGGFSKNPLFIAMLKKEFPGLSIQSLGFHEGTALGAAMHLGMF